VKASIFLRIASVLTLIHAVMHTIGGVFGKPAPGVAAMVAETMRTNRFEVLGAIRSYADFYRGMGLGVTIFLTVEAVAFWLLASLVRSGGVRFRPLLGAFLLGYLALAVNSWLYFFSGPVIAELLIAVCLGIAMLTAKPVERKGVTEAM
jgi:hypothetical protein